MIVQWIRKSEVGSVPQLCHALKACTSRLIGIGADEVIKGLSAEQLSQWSSGADVVHAGLSFSSGSAFESVQLCTFNWHFLEPLADRQVVSWKATRDFVLFDRGLLEIVGFIDERYTDPDAALMDWVYRALLAGAKTVHQPLPIKITVVKRRLELPADDEMLFVCKYFSHSARTFYRVAQFFLHRQWLKADRLYSVHRAPGSDSGAFKLTSISTNISVDSYAALIPTIDRYDYISASIKSLLALTYPPAEIVVVDQTPWANRRPEVYREFLNGGVVKLIFLEKAGQSTARNIGLKAISHEWVLLFEDDAEAWPDMVAEHISLIQRSGCDVSSGVIVPPGSGREFIPERNRKFCLSEILTTGNAFMKVETALSVGGFDPAFNHGPGADDDFGKRLYLSGRVIVYNYRSIETHHKAPRGGMRVHGIWWRNRSSLFGPYPPVTQTYMIKKYYGPHLRVFLFISMILKARKKYSQLEYLLFLLLLPYKFAVSVIRARSLKTFE